VIVVWLLEFSHVGLISDYIIDTLRAGIQYICT